MNWTESKYGLVIPEQKREVPKPEPRRLSDSEVSEPIGYHADGSFTLCPEAFKALRKVMMERSGICRQFTIGQNVEALEDVIWIKQGVGFEQWS